MATCLGKRACRLAYRESSRTGWSYREVPSLSPPPPLPHLLVAKVPPRPARPRPAPPRARPRPASLGWRGRAAFAEVSATVQDLGWVKENSCLGPRPSGRNRQKRPARGGWTQCEQALPGPPHPENPQTGS